MAFLTFALGLGLGSILPMSMARLVGIGDPSIATPIHHLVAFRETTQGTGVSRIPRQRGGRHARLDD